MVRLARYDVPDIPRHVIQRGNNRGVTFVADEDYVFYLECLADAAARWECAVHAYVLMTNHVHLLVTPGTGDGLGRMMQSLGRRYVRYFNHTQQRTGTLWEGRYRATWSMPATISSPAAATSRSSWRTHAEGEPSDVVADHPQYTALGATPPARQAAYRALFALAWTRRR